MDFYRVITTTHYAKRREAPVHFIIFMTISWEAILALQSYVYLLRAAARKAIL